MTQSTELKIKNKTKQISPPKIKKKNVTFIPCGCNVIEPFLHTGHSMGWVFMATPCYLGYCRHRTFQSTTRFGNHGVMAQMKIQCLYNIGRMITRA